MDIATHQQPGTIYAASRAQGLPAPVLRHRVIGPVNEMFLVVYAGGPANWWVVAGEATTRDLAEQEAVRLDAEQSYKEEIERMPTRLAQFRTAQRGFD